MLMLNELSQTTAVILFGIIFVYGLLPRLTGQLDRLNRSDNPVVGLYRFTILISPIFMLIPGVILGAQDDIRYGYLSGPLFVFVLWLAQRVDVSDRTDDTDRRLLK